MNLISDLIDQITFPFFSGLQIQITSPFLTYFTRVNNKIAIKIRARVALTNWKTIGSQMIFSKYWGQYRIYQKKSFVRKKMKKRSTVNNILSKEKGRNKSKRGSYWNKENRKWL